MKTKLVITGISEKTHKAIELLQDRLNFELTSNEGIKVLVEYNKGRSFSVQKQDSIVKIICGKQNQLFRALGLLSENINTQTFSFDQTAAFETLSLMVDNSRNGVMNIDAAKDLIITLALFGYDELLLYTEDTYEVQNQPYFGYLRGRFSQAEIAELDEFCALFGMTLVPCIQTLAHLNTIFKWPEYASVRDCIDVLLANNDKTYKLIEDMLRTVSQTYSTKKVNIGMDEAHFVGIGNFLYYNGYIEKYKIMTDHLTKVCEIAEKYGLKPYIWSDMFFRPTFGDYYVTEKTRHKNIPQEVADNIPKNVSLVYWDYNHSNIKDYDIMFEKHRVFNNKVAFAGGCWKWTGPAPFNKYGMKMSEPALKSCLKNNVSEVIATVWSDDGAECPVFAVLPQIAMYAEFCYTQNYSYKHLSKRMKTCADAIYSDFLKLDIPNEIVDGKLYNFTNPCKYFLYSDSLLGIADYYVQDRSYADIYKHHAKTLKVAAKRNQKYKHIFDSLALLCDLLSLKSGIGVRMKQAYESKDYSKLNGILIELKKCILLAKKYFNAVKHQWAAEYKPFGREVIDIKISGVIARLEAAYETVFDYVNKKTTSIPELEEPRLPYNSLNDEILPNISKWNLIATPGILVDRFS